MAMDFGDALRAMKGGKKVARYGWNGKRMYVYFVGCFADQERVYSGCFVIHPARGEYDQPGWLASQSDLLGCDWYVVPDAAAAHFAAPPEEK